MARVLALLAEGFEEIEAVTVIDVLRRAEVAVTVASLGARPVTGSREIVVHADVELAAVAPPDGASAFDLVYLPGGADGMRRLAEDPRVGERLRSQLASGGRIAAICAAPAALHRHGVLPPDVRVTSHPSVADELAAYTYTEERVVVDGPFVTSRGAGTAMELALALVALLADGPTSRGIGEAMLVAR